MESRWSIRLLTFVALCVPLHALAQSCTLPIPFQYEFQHAVTATLSGATTSDPCSLSVALSVGAGPVASGFLHYRRAKPLTSVRYGFRVDASALTNFAIPNRVVQVFAATSPTVVSGWPHLLLVSLSGGSNPGPALNFLAATSGAAPHFVDVSASTSSLVNEVRVEINVGSGTNGYVRYWINHAFTDPPDGVIDNRGAGLDNAAWIGVIGAEVGLSSPLIHFRNDYSGGPALVFDQIESSDDVLFFDDFSSGAQQ